MRLVTMVHEGETKVGVRKGDGVVPTDYNDMVSLIADGDLGLHRAARAARDLAPVQPERILAPVPAPSKVLCCGVNYASHKEENPDAVFPSEPFFFSKLPSAVIGPGEEIVIPREGMHVDYEVELAFVVGKAAKNVAQADALEFVFGWTVLHDVSAREIQFKENQITLGKGVDTFCPIGPEIVTVDEIPDPSQLRVRTEVNGEERQSSSTADMLFAVPHLIEFLTQIVTLVPGDVVSTGTPAGVAAFRDGTPWLVPGDEVTVEVDRIGKLTNPVVAGW
jgi:2-keto-4-pentenoate hydratase/2-oxohepta-3-ene-1,7-dioic acid hydratase in catechol pathway